MKYGSLLLFLSMWYSLCNAQSETKKQCQPPSIVFKNFQRKNLNILTGFTGTRIKSENKDYWGYGASAVINYFPINYFEIGYRFNPFYIKYYLREKTLLAEHNLYVKYYYLNMSCRKVLFSASTGILKDGSSYNAKGEIIDPNKIFVYVSPLDLTLLLGKWGRVDGNTDIFLNNRSIKFNLSLLFNIHNIKL